MRTKFVGLLFLATLLSGCAGSVETVNMNIKKASSFSLGEDIYLKSGGNGWTESETSKLTYNSTATVPYSLLGVTFAANEEFKLHAKNSDNWIGVNCTTEVTARHFTTANASDPYANFKTVDAGTYDVYFTSNYQSTGAWKVFVVKSAATLLAAQDLNYTRTTEIKATTEYFTELTAKNYFTSITRNRTTEFIDNGLYMHDTTGTTTNSGYYTRKNEDSGVNMYHYTLAGSSDNRTVASTLIENERRDSTTKNTNDFFANGHYFHDNAAAIGALMTFDFNNFNYYLPLTGNETYVTQFMYFTAPLFTNPTDAPITFNGAGIKDVGTTISYYIYSSDATKLDASANTVFAQADITNIGTTTIPFLDKYINQ
ncbi:MAG: hypothetical protein LKJ88_00815 [Bacilli bacterium]|jgi:hypothetical protein|nr:hypothetical protein [Bacilli bacterium]